MKSIKALKAEDGWDNAGHIKILEDVLKLIDKMNSIEGYLIDKDELKAEIEGK